MDEVIQVAFVVPDWILTGIRSGEYKIFGGVIRNTKGQIVYHLKNGIWEATKEGANNVVKAIEKAPGKAKVFAIAVAGFAIAGTIGYASYKILTDKNSLKKFSKFDEKLENYLNDSIKGTLSLDKIIELKNSCDELIKILDKIDNNEVDAIQYENKKFNELVNAIKRYTDELSKANKSNKVIPERNDGDTIKNNIIDLRKYIEIQKEIYASC